MFSKDQAQQLVRIASANWTPAPRHIFKPTRSGEGAVLVLQLRLDPVFAVGKQGKEYVDRKNSDGGLFMDLAPQGKEKTADGFATFDYKSDKAVTAKLGMPDVTKLLVGYQRVRLLGKGVPKALRRKPTQEHPEGDPTTVALFHQTPGGGTCAITWTFGPESSTVRMSRSTTQQQRINLTLDEELIIKDILEDAVRAFNQFGY